MGLSTTAAFVALASAMTAMLKKLGLDGWHVKYCDWDDASRAEGSCWGNNITDVFIKYFKDGAWRATFAVGTENFNPTGVYVDLNQIQVVVQDADTGESRVTDAEDLLRHVGKHCPHRGLAPDATLVKGEATLKCFLKTQVIVVPCNEGEEVDLAIFATNYQARQDPRNAMLLCNGQGVTLQLDKPNFHNQARYCLSEYHKPSDTSREFAMTTDVSKRTVAQCGTETKEEAEQAVREGKTAEVPLGPKGCKKSGSIMTIQVPIQQDKVRASGRAAEPAPAAKKQKPEDRPGSPDSEATAKTEAPVDGEDLVAISPDDYSRPPGAPSQKDTSGHYCPSGDVEDYCYPSCDKGGDEDYYYSLCDKGDDDDGSAFASLSASNGGDSEPAFRSLSGLEPPAPAPAVVAEEAGPATRMGMEGLGSALPDLNSERCKMGRIYKGRYLGPLAPLTGTDLERDEEGGVVTVVKSIVVTCPVGEEPTEKDVVEMIKLAHEDLDVAVNKCDGKGANLFSDLAKKLGHVTEGLTPKAVGGIVETVKAMTGSVPAGVF